MNGGKRALTPWNKFVKKIYSEGKSKDDSYSFQEALKDASKRKSEMGAVADAPVAARGTKKSRKSRKARKSARRNSKRSIAAQIAGTRRRKH
jgi:hypothetical protein